jgi:Lrp/AsnC family transcriptional regulator, leucine-responsive regulatory protein
MLKIDDKNAQLLKLLETNSKLSIKDLSKLTKMPATTVHTRIKRLESSGIIRGYTAILDNERLGKTIGAYILISVQPSEKKVSQQEIGKKIATREEVESVSIITGNQDIIVKARVESISKLNQFITHYIRNIDGVGKTETMIILEDID